MEYRTLANGVSMPILGFGTYLLQNETCTEMVKYAIEQGYEAIDTAQAYENEEAVGEGIRQSGKKRDDIFITSKIRNRFHGYDNTLMAVENTLTTMGLEQMDLFLIHWPGENMYVPTWKALVRMYDEGLIRAIGVSNFLPEHMEQAAQATGRMPMVNQFETHPYLHQYEIIDYCKNNDVFPIAWSPLMVGGEVLDDPVILNIAERYEKTTAQTILRWHLQNGFGVIPKSSHPDRILQNKDIFDFELTEIEMEEMNQLTKKQIRVGDDPATYRFLLLDELKEKK
ncbi:MAG: aldo/keto reductase [Anaerostipes sp.]|nr:aldo/keto reductase [Anaerostipes sp.]